MEATEKTGHDKKKIIAIAAVVAVLGLAFYWLSVRPHFIKTSCYQTVKEAIGPDGEGEYYLTPKNAQVFQSYYEACTHKQGL